MNDEVLLKNVYRTRGAVDVLYRLLAERDSRINISHRRMPSLSEHKKFVASKPYKSWDLVMYGGRPVGSVYLSKQNEIGLFIFKKHQGGGIGRKALALLYAKHPREHRFLANINPVNAASIRFFKRMGFGHIQNTYELRKRG